MEITGLNFLRLPLSHRKCKKIVEILGFRPQKYFSLDTSSQFIFLNNDDYDKARDLVTKSRFRGQIYMCWNTGNARFLPNQPYKTPATNPIGV